MTVHILQSEYYFRERKEVFIENFRKKKSFSVLFFLIFNDYSHLAIRILFQEKKGGVSENLEK